MELVCGITGVNADRLKMVREKSKGVGFKCRFDSRGWLCFKQLEGSDWKGLLSLLEVEVGILPLYFRLGSRAVGLDYGLDCLKGKRSGLLGAKIGLNPLYGLGNVLIGARLGSINNVLIRKNGKN